MSAYATVADLLVYGIGTSAIPGTVTDANKLAAITAASAKADSYLGSRFTLPITVWGADLTAAVCQIAAYEIIAALVGFNPEDGKNVVLVDRKNDAVRWLEQVARGMATPTGVTDSSSGGVGTPSARAYSRPSRGWNRC